MGASVSGRAMHLQWARRRGSIARGGAAATPHRVGLKVGVAEGPRHGGPVACDAEVRHRALEDPDAHEQQPKDQEGDVEVS